MHAKLQMPVLLLLQVSMLRWFLGLLLLTFRLLFLLLVVFKKIFLLALCILTFRFHLYSFDAGLTSLTHLDLFCARITDSGTNYLRRMLYYSLSFALSAWDFVLLTVASIISTRYTKPVGNWDQISNGPRLRIPWIMGLLMK